MKSVTQKSFSLLELMFAVAIIVLLVMMMMKILDMTTLAIKGSRRILDANHRACFALDRLNLDLKKMVLRNDVQPFFTNGPLGEDRLRFLATIKAPEADRRVSLIAYRLLKDDRGLSSLQRGIRGYQWQDRGFMGLDEKGEPTDLMTLPQKINLREKDYEDLIEGVVQCAVCFQYKSDGKVHLYPPLAAILPGSTNQFASGNKFIQTTNIASIIVGLVLVDFKNTSEVSSENNQAFTSLFTLPPDGVTPQAHWQSNLVSSAFTEKKEAVLPGRIESSLRIYQRFFPIESLKD